MSAKEDNYYLDLYARQLDEDDFDSEQEEPIYNDDDDDD